MLYAFFWVGRYEVLNTYSPTEMEKSVPKHWHLKYRCWFISQKKAYNILNMAKV
jgi:hypothetical protein